MLLLQSSQPGFGNSKCRVAALLSQELQAIRRSFEIQICRLLIECSFCCDPAEPESPISHFLAHSCRVDSATDQYCAPALASARHRPGMLKNFRSMNCTQIHHIRRSAGMLGLLGSSIDVSLAPTRYAPGSTSSRASRAFGRDAGERSIGVFCYLLSPQCTFRRRSGRPFSVFRLSELLLNWFQPLGLLDRLCGSWFCGALTRSASHMWSLA